MEDIKRFDFVYFMTHKQYGMVNCSDNINTILMFELNQMYIKQIEPEYPDMVCTQIMFDGETLGVREKGQYLKHGGVKIGVWEYYNEDGTLNYTENMDEHFPIIWENMEQILQDKNISLLKADSIFRYYDEEKDEANWSIIINIPMDKGISYVFDAKTGEQISEKIIDMSKEL